MQKSLQPVLGFLDDGILAPTTESILFTSFSNGQAVTAPRLMKTFDLSDFIDEVYGTAGDDAIFAEGGDDKVNGAAGNDYIDGGSGHDRLYGGDGDDHLIGGAGNDWLQGDAGNDVLIGGTGNDTMLGGVGDDLYVVADAGDIVTEYAGQGRDTVMSKLATYQLGANVENLVADASLANAAVNFTGNELNNDIVGGNGNDMLSGGAGNDELDGKAGADRMVGGTGNDLYHVDLLGDQTIELAGEGNDTVIATRSWQIAANIENLHFENTAAAPTQGFVGYGNELANEISGAAGSDDLYGFGGDDRLNGGGGADFLYGGAGNDVYYLAGEGGDTIIENAGEGIDRVYANLAEVTLADNVENLDFYINYYGGQIVGPAAFTAHGNASANEITGWELGDKLYGGDGNDKLYGLGGDDLLDGGNGNDSLDGGSGNNTLIGGVGNDTYFVNDDQRDTIIETAEAGSGSHDMVMTRDAVTTLRANVEDMRYVGTADFLGLGNSGNNEITGGSGVDNWLYGMDGNDVLVGGAKTDYLDGGSGADTMRGGLGADEYFVDSIWDVVAEKAGEGYDIVDTSLDSYVLGANVEALRMVGANNAIGVGNDVDNQISGSTSDDQLFGKGGDDELDGGKGNDRLDGGTGDDQLDGGAGDDTLYGGLGYDHLTGGTGKDVFSFRQANPGNLQVIMDFVKGEDRIDFTAIDGNAALAGDQQLAMSFNGQFVGGGQGSFYVEKGPYGGTYYTYVHVDANGDGKLDLDVMLTSPSGYYALSIGDFGL